MRIAVIQAGLPLQGYTRDMVNGLAAEGFTVDLLIDPSRRPPLVDAATLRARLCPLPSPPLLRLLDRLRIRWAKWSGGRIQIVPPWTHNVVSRRVAAGPPYDLFIGVEKAGLEIAARLGKRFRVPYLYHSLELYIEGHPLEPHFRWQRPSEIDSHRHAAATIIQDATRWQCLRDANRPASESAFFLPVGVDGGMVDRNADAPAPPGYLLYLGILRGSRFITELMALADSLPPDVNLWLHGPMDWEDPSSAPRPADQGRLRLSTRLLSESDMQTLTANALAGLALYRRDYVNDRHTAFSSQKIALYLACGVPIITFRSETYEALFDKHPCGEMIDTLEDIPGAMARILADRPRYSRAARKAFAEIYDFRIHQAALANFLRGIPPVPPATP